MLARCREETLEGFFMMLIVFELKNQEVQLRLRKDRRDKDSNSRLFLASLFFFFQLLFGTEKQRQL